MKRRRRSHALRRRYGRSTASPDALFHEAEAAYKKGLEAARRGYLTVARDEAVRVGELALRANRAGLDPKRYGVALRAQAILLEKAHGVAA
jgi:hypothetical protein